ncbi:hypothetical protein [Erythrobacter sp. SD-21]|uniref:hypothetical protein n=1 Tax=Erythrobacter sp. SD-21 TaxID=161528 RepID=UPI000153EF29|nr:hypothetical protein [Erythrobacter sp. SD-21]EDL50383.1 hypothetical protein ED21_27968 [Erythrobacter sp. SD-21]
MTHLVYRDRVHTEGELAGKTERYWPDPDVRGLYELGDPQMGKTKHHKPNAIFVEEQENAVRLVREYGFSLRMRGELTGQRNLISPKEIRDVANA